jgi:hypothetical protein
MLGHHTLGSFGVVYIFQCRLKLKLKFIVAVIVTSFLNYVGNNLEDKLKLLQSVKEIYEDIVLTPITDTNQHVTAG